MSRRHQQYLLLLPRNLQHPVGVSLSGFHTPIIRIVKFIYIFRSDSSSCIHSTVRHLASASDFSDHAVEFINSILEIS